MSTITTPPSWVSAAREKLTKHAAAQTKDDQAIAEAFAQQAYTAVGNRDRRIMCDPYLLGFEIVDKNEDNNRLVGVFAFRVSGEILMVPVFFLNGNIKGHDLIYRKPVNRFYPNTEKWVNYFLSRGEDASGRGVDRRSNSDARMHLGIDRMSRMPGGYKRAGAEYNRFTSEMNSNPEASIPGEFSKWLNNTQLLPADQKFRPTGGSLGDNLNQETSAGNPVHPFGFNQWLNNKETPLRHDPATDTFIPNGHTLPPVKAAADEGPIDIKAEWKLACDNSGFRPEHMDQFMFADFLVDHGMQKQAADLAGKLPWFADSIALAGLLDKPLTKKAAAPNDSLEYHVDPVPGSTEAQVAAHYARGYSFVDKRAAESLAAAIESSPISRTWSTLRKPGINRVAGKDGSFQKVLWAPTTSGGNDFPCAQGERRHTSNPGHRLVFLDGPDKGCVITYRGGCAEDSLPLFTDDAEMEKEAAALSKGIQAGFNTSPARAIARGVSRLWNGAPPTPPAPTPMNPSWDKVPGAQTPHDPEMQGMLDRVDADIEQEADRMTPPATKPLPAAAAQPLGAVPSPSMPAPAGGISPALPPVPNPMPSALDKAPTMSAPAFNPTSTDNSQEYQASFGKKAASDEVPGDSTPKKGKTYVVWLPTLGKLFGDPIRIDSLESTGDVTKINFEKGKAYGESNCRIILRKDLSETCMEDLTGGAHGHLPRVIGSDAVWVPVEAQLEYAHGMPQTAANVNYASFQPPASFQPVTLNTLDDALRNSKQASITIERNPKSGLFSLRDPKGKIRVEDYSSKRLAIKLARDLRLPAEEAIELVDLAKTQDKTAFTLLPPGYMEGVAKAFNGTVKAAADSADNADKTAAAFYDHDIDPNIQFQDHDWDEDMDIPVENAGMYQDFAEARRERYTRPQPHYLDAHDPGQGRNRSYGDPDHIPDDVILKMVHPMQEMAQLGQQMGLDTLMDHGAVASMVKVYDVKPYMREYLGKLENSLDQLGRLVFMLYWKPKDFSELFGQDDIPQIENKLTGVFSSFGDIILELLQSSGEKV